MNVIDALNCVKEGRIEKTSTEDLKAMLHCLATSGQPALAMVQLFQNSILMLQDEIARRERASHHQEETGQNKSRHQETMGEIDKLKTSVDKLARARCVDKWILIFGAIAAIAAVILLFRGH
jgi:hypothetical protein